MHESAEALSCNILVNVVGPVYKQGLVPVSRNLIYGITTDLAGVDVIQYLELVIETQLLVQELHQLLETACIHMPLQLP